MASLPRIRLLDVLLVCLNLLHLKYVQACSSTLLNVANRIYRPVVFGRTLVRAIVVTRHGSANMDDMMIT